MDAHTPTRSIALAVGALLVTALAGCGAGSPVAQPTPDSSPAVVEYDPPEEGWCLAYGGTLNRWGGATKEIDEPRFEEVLGLDFIGPADCYLELSSSGATKSVVAVFIGDDDGVADFMTSTLPAAGWLGEIADPLKGGVFSHPELGDLGYHFSENAKKNNIPVDGPVALVTLLLAG